MAQRKKRTRRANFPKEITGPGRPGWKPEPADLKKIESLAQRAVPKKVVAAAFGFSESHWHKLEAKYPHLSQSYVKGLQYSHTKAFAKLDEHIHVKDSERMLSYYLDKVYGLDPKQGVNVTIDNSTTTTTNNIQINLEKLSNEELKSLAEQSIQSLDSVHEIEGSN